MEIRGKTSISRKSASTGGELLRPSEMLLLTEVAADSEIEWWQGQVKVCRLRWQGHL